MGLVNTKNMFEKAYSEGYAVGAFNVNNMETIQSVTQACNELRSPVILQISSGAMKYAKSVEYLIKLIEISAEENDIPIALHLDHGDTFELCKKCIDLGFTSVMIDGSHMSYEKNVEVTKNVVDYAHKNGVTVEGELGRLAGIEDSIEVSNDESFYTCANQAKDFVSKTNVDSLAVAIGTSHGAYKFKSGKKPELRFDILEKIQNKLENFPIVLHGASSVSTELVEEINKYGGNLENVSGIPEEILKKASAMSICKINIDSDLRLAITAAIRKYLSNNPKDFDPRSYLALAKEYVKNVVRHKVKNVMGCADKA